MTPQEIKSKAFDEIADATATWESSDKKDRLLCILGQIDGIILMACNMINTSEKEPSIKDCIDNILKSDTDDSENEKQKEGE